MNFSESKKISQYTFTKLIKVLKFVTKKNYLECNTLIMQIFEAMLFCTCCTCNAR